MRAKPPAAPRTPSVLALAVVIFGMGGLGYACVENKSTSNQPSTSSGTESTTGPFTSTSSSTDSFNKSALLASLAESVIVPTYADFVASATALETAAATYAADTSGANQTAVQQAWRDAMAVWQRAELMQVGPAAVAGLVAGGEDLRDEIYSWSIVNRCAVDQNVVAGNYTDANAFKSQLVNVRGLDAMEYLLFNDTTANACPPQVPINADGTWDALTDLDERRAAYVSTLATITREHAELLHERWRADGGNYAAQLSNAGMDSENYDTAQQALNGVSDAMFYIEGIVKDRKLAIPIGLSPDCGDDTCANDLELRFSRQSKVAIRENLNAFTQMLNGADDGLGFDDWLDALGAADVATTMNEKIAAIHTALDAIGEDDLVSALTADKDSVEALYFALKELTDVLKSDFVTVLDLELPQTVQGDND